MFGRGAIRSSFGPSTAGLYDAFGGSVPSSHATSMGSAGVFSPHGGDANRSAGPAAAASPSADAEPPSQLLQGLSLDFLDDMTGGGSPADNGNLGAGYGAPSAPVSSLGAFGAPPMAHHAAALFDAPGAPKASTAASGGAGASGTNGWRGTGADLGTFLPSGGSGYAEAPGVVDDAVPPGGRSAAPPGSYASRLKRG